MVYRAPKKRAAPRQEKDEQGRRLCRRCKALVPKGLRSYCSRKCRTEFEIAYFPTYARRAVRGRDKGVCGKCGTDTALVRRIARHLRSSRGRGRDYWDSGRDMERSFLADIGFPGALHEGDFWQADHIQECARGGWGLGLENFRTLCTPCHKEETARLAAELAAKRREEQNEKIRGLARRVIAADADLFAPSRRRAAR